MALGAGLLATAVPVRAPATIGLDHIPVAVRDLERASATYGALGFALKPGRDHANGMRNAHVKFPDGAGIVLSEGEVVILPASHQALAGRPVIGASFRVSDLTTVRRILDEARIRPRAGVGAAERVVVEPGVAHGLWLEFRPAPTAAASPARP